MLPRWTCVVLLGCGGSPAPAAEAPPPQPLPVVVVMDAGSDPSSPVPEVTGGSSWTDDPAAKGADVVMTVDFARVRKLPDAASVAAILAAAPEWRDVPVDALDWLRVSGPSLVTSRDDEVLTHASLTDAELDAKVAALVRKAHGSPLVLHAHGVKAWKVTVDHSDRAFLHPATQLVAVVPLASAEGRAADLAAHPPAAPPMHTDEIVRLRGARPGAAITGFPTDVSEARLWVDGHADGTADVYFEGDCPSADAADADADFLRNWVNTKNSMVVQLVTAGLLNRATFTTVGTMVRGHVPASHDQLRAVLRLLAGVVNATLP